MGETHRVASLPRGQPGAAALESSPGTCGGRCSAQKRKIRRARAMARSSVVFSRAFLLTMRDEVYIKRRYTVVEALEAEQKITSSAAVMHDGTVAEQKITPTATFLHDGTDVEQKISTNAAFSHDGIGAEQKITSTAGLSHDGTAAEHGSSHEDIVEVEACLVDLDPEVWEYATLDWHGDTVDVQQEPKFELPDAAVDAEMRIASTAPSCSQLVGSRASAWPRRRRETRSPVDKLYDLLHWAGTSVHISRLWSTVGLDGDDFSDVLVSAEDLGIISIDDASGTVKLKKGKGKGTA